jgi:uncharacterized protein with von Willebrand factor type A (vWA) domain
MPKVKGINYQDPPVRYRGERVLTLLRKLSPELADRATRTGLLDVDFAISVYYMMFLPFPIVNAESKGGERELLQYAILSAMMESSKFRETRRHTIADATTSMVASAVFLEALMRELNNTIKPQGGESKGGKTSESQEGPQPSQLRDAVEKALSATKDVASQAKEITNLAMRFSAGNTSMLSLDDVIQDVINLAKNTDVKMILEALKTLENPDARIRIRKKRSTRGELDGYEYGSDIERIVVSELALPTELFLLKFAERNLLLYKKIVPEDYGKFYVLLDKSGSMMGMKIIWAKAVTLALAQRAVREGREFYLRFFDSIPYPPLYISRRVHGRDVIKLLEYVARIRANGGTDITRAILTAVDDISSRGGTRKISDIVLITDGEDKIAVDLVRKSLNRINARLHTVMISGNNPDLRLVSDSYMVATKLDRDEALKVISFGS